MIKKLSIEEFRKIRNRLFQIYEQADKFITENSDNDDVNLEEEEKKFVEQYIDVQKELLSYNLSDIPFEEWKGVQIISGDEYTADLSATEANIDFELIELYGKANFIGCNIKNLHKIITYLDPKNFDSKIISENPDLFLSDLFPEQFKEKYYRNKLTIEDIKTLTDNQIEELSKKKIEYHSDINMTVYNNLGLKKLIELYNYSKDEYYLIQELLLSYSTRYYGNYKYGISYQTFSEQLKNAEVSEMKSICYEYLRKNLLTSKYNDIKIEELPEIFVRENSDILLTDTSIPQELRERYYSRKLSLEDIINNADIFDDIPVEFFLDLNNFKFYEIGDLLGYGNLQKIIKKYPGIVSHILESDNVYFFTKCLSISEDYEKNFIQAVKKYFLKCEINDNFKSEVDGKVYYNVPEWIKPLNLSFIEELKTKEDLFSYNINTLILNEKHQLIIDLLGIDNIKKFDQETGFFTNKSLMYSSDLEMLNAFASYFFNRNYLTNDTKLDFKHGELAYEDFVDEMAYCLDTMRKNNLFTDYPNYDWIKGKFRAEHPEIFISENAPEELKRAFYKNKIDPEFLCSHKEYIPYLFDKNLVNTIKLDMKLSVPSLSGENGMSIVGKLNFIDEYTKRYGNEKFLNLVSKYGIALSDVEVLSFNNEIDDEKLIEKSLRAAIYKSVLQSNINYEYLSHIPEFVSEYPDIFLNDDNVDQTLRNDFYNGNISFESIKREPKLIDVLKDKNLKFVFRKNNRAVMSRSRWQNYQSDFKEGNDLNFLDAYGNEQFLQLCLSYGRYLTKMDKYLQDNNTKFESGKYIDKKTGSVIPFDEITKRIENLIIQQCFAGNIFYQPEDAPEFLKKGYPELFLDENAPDELKKYYYGYGNNYILTFEKLNQNKEWLPYLNNKSISASLLKKSYFKNEMIKYFELFGEEKAIKLGISRSETVTKMIESQNVELMKSWYDKTGQKFIPDYVVMQNFDIAEADKFLLAGSSWSTLMKIKSFANTSEGRDAMLKLAYSFGVFDQEQAGFKRLHSLLTELPRNISSNYSHIINHIISFGRNSIEPLNAPQGYNEYIRLKDVLISEGFTVNDSQEIFSQIYKKNTDGSYTLTINPQSYPNSCALIRNILELFPDSPIITPNKAHHLFGRFKLKYDKDFRNFFLANLDEIMNDSEKAAYISSIQRQFDEIKVFYKNIKLTLDNAISFVKTNKFEDVNVGNELAADVISKLDQYTEEDFYTLQQIYNYGKQRTFSSIPRIENTSGKYTYEMLRLDDPLAMVVGTLTDCCQELGNCAEVCMQHSMVDKNGRIFVVRDQSGSIVAQSWVWRNKNVLCFDNIEVPDQQMWDHGVQRGYEDSGIRNEFTDEVLEVYRQAAHELIVEDEKVLKELLESGKITKEQYEGLKLSKVTAGLGFSNIKGSFSILNVDHSISRPLLFVEPVKLKRSLYTNDSNTQYILEETGFSAEYNGETLPIHSDIYIKYDDSNFYEKNLLLLEKLEIITKENSSDLEIANSNFSDKEHLVTEISKNYGLNCDTTKIVMNSNFAIIYDVNEDKVRIADLLFNVRVDNKEQQLDIEKPVVMQIRLALEQIGTDREIDISALDEKQKEMYFKVMSISDDMDIERGVGHGR